MISYKGYTGVFEYDETIDALAGHMVDIAGEIYFEGRSVEEVKESARRAVDHYLQACEARGVKPDRPYSGRITVSTSPEVHGLSRSRLLGPSARRISGRRRRWRSRPGSGTPTIPAALDVQSPDCGASITRGRVSHVLHTRLNPAERVIQQRQVILYRRRRAGDRCHQPHVDAGNHPRPISRGPLLSLGSGGSELPPRTPPSFVSSQDASQPQTPDRRGRVPHKPQLSQPQTLPGQSAKPDAGSVRGKACALQS